MASLRAYGPPESRVQQTQFWARYFPERQQAKAEFDLRQWSAAQDAQYRQDQADAAAEQQDFSNRVNLSRYATGLDMDERRAAEDARRFGIDTGLRERQLTLYGGNARDVAAERLAAQRERMGERTAEQMNAYAADAASVGAFDPSQFPTLPPELRQMHAARNKMTRDEIDAEDAVVRNAANVLNSHAQLLRQRTAVPTIHPEFQAELNQQIMALEPHVKALTNPRNPLSQQLEYDDATGRWSPILTPRSWRASAPTQAATPPALSQFAPTTATVTTPPPIPAPSARNDLVAVFNPAGQPVKIRRSQLTDAIAKGYRLR